MAGEHNKLFVGRIFLHKGKGNFCSAVVVIGEGVIHKDGKGLGFCGDEFCKSKTKGEIKLVFGAAA